MFGILLKGGTIVDGLGGPGYRADIAISGDRISEIGYDLEENADEIIDITGKTVIPGIIDIHSHADLTIHRDDHQKILEPLIRQGITTVITGNCGMAMAPVTERYSDQVIQLIEAFTGVKRDEIPVWKTMDDFFNHLENHGLLLNTAVLVPHGIIRIGCNGLVQGSVDTDVLQSMRRIVAQSIEEGAIGLSTGLQYFPGSQSDLPELIALAKEVSRRGGIFTSHLRSYSNTLNKAIEEVVTIGKMAGLPVHISHLFWMPDLGIHSDRYIDLLRSAARMTRHFEIPLPLDRYVEIQLEKMKRWRQRGLQLSADVMPTTTAFTHALALFPPWSLVGDIQSILDRLAGPKSRPAILRSIETGMTVWPHRIGDSWSLNLLRIMGFASIRIMAVGSEANKHTEGRPLIELARKSGDRPFDYLCDLLVEERGKVLIFISIAGDDPLTERSLYASIKDESVSFSTDTILMGFGKPSSLFYSCYPKILARYVAKKGLLTFASAVRKMTALPAEQAGLTKRGSIKKGNFADLVILDRTALHDPIDSRHDAEFPPGIERVYVNGSLVLAEGVFFGNTLPGRLLRGRGRR